MVDRPLSTFKWWIATPEKRTNGNHVKGKDIVIVFQKQAFFRTFCWKYSNFQWPNRPPSAPKYHRSKSPQSKASEQRNPFLVAEEESLFLIPSRELTYPTLGKGKSSSKCNFFGDMLVPWRVWFPSWWFLGLFNQIFSWCDHIFVDYGPCCQMIRDSFFQKSEVSSLINWKDVIVPKLLRKIGLPFFSCWLLRLSNQNCTGASWTMIPSSLPSCAFAWPPFNLPKHGSIA